MQRSPHATARTRRISILLFEFLLIGGLFTSPAHPAMTVLTVDSNAQKDGPGDTEANCTLGDAIVAANNDALEDSCSHPNLGTGGPFQIILPAGSGPYTLTAVDNFEQGNNGLPAIKATITILGNGNTIQRDPSFACPDPINPVFRIFRVGADDFFAPSGDLTLTDLTINNGCDDFFGGGAILIQDPRPSTQSRATVINSTLSGHFTGGNGGAINSRGTLAITNSVLSGNSARDGGALSTGAGGNETTTISDTTISNNAAINHGGGIFNFGILSIDNTSLTDNLVLNGVGTGGAISNAGSVTINDSTISGNAAGTGGAIANGDTIRTGPDVAVVLTKSTVSDNSAGFGGSAISTDYSPVFITNTTISGNSGGIALTSNQGSMSIVSSTLFANSSGGVFVKLSGGITLTNTILDDSRCSTLFAVITDGGHNIESGNTCGFAVSSSMVNTDPMLAPLSDNGGPTMTHALLDGSPAIDAGSNDCPPPATDQRGVDRPQGTACDIGAFEFVVATQIVGIDIRPGSQTNPISLRSRGVIPVAILSSPDLDAPGLVDRASLTFGRSGDEVSLVSCAEEVEDVNADGLPDLLCLFRTGRTGLLRGDTQAILKGNLLDAREFMGADSVRIVPLSRFSAAEPIP